MSDPRIDAHGSPNSAPRLSPEDAALIDRVFERIEAAERVDDDQSFREIVADLRSEAPDDLSRDRLAAIGALLGELDHYPVADADDTLVDATMARVDRLDADMATLPLQQIEDRGGRLRFRIPDLIGLAAAVLLAVGVFMPVGHRIRQASVDTRCMNNLRIVGMANSRYAQDFDGWLPIRAGLFSWDRGSGSDNLAVLSEQGYCEHGALCCPGHHGNAPHHGYAFRAMDSAERARIGMAPLSILMADRSHVIDYARNGGPVTNLVVPSANHGHRGQNILFGSLEVRWTTTPKIDGVRGGLDNIYLILVAPGTEDLTPGQRTLSADDHFTH